MPHYSYRCNSCGQIFELILSMKDHSVPTTEPCPRCRATTVQQVITYTPQIVPRETLTIGKKLPGEWKNFLHRLDQKNPGSNMKNVKIY